MARIDVLDTDVLVAVQKRLMEELSLDARRCYITADPEVPPKIARIGDWFISVAQGESLFAHGNQAAGNLTEESTFIVTPYTRIRLDHPDQDDKLILALDRGLGPLRRKILKALIGHDLAMDNGDTCLRELIYATSSGRYQYDPEEQTGWRGTHFGVDFDIDIETE